ncbi:hypothetical protein [Agromyces bauzanensis]
MPTAFDVRALASTVRIELDDTLSADERESVRSQWVDLILDEADTPKMTIRATLDAAVRSVKTLEERDLPGGSVEELADEIASEVTLAAIDGLSGEALMLHAAATALEDGRVIGFVGPSGRGKTTAAQALSLGHRYVTDETLAIRPDGTVVPFPKPLSIGARPGRKEHVAASALGLRPASADGLRLAALVLLDRRPDVEQPYVESVHLVDALPEVVSQSSFLTRLDRPLRSLAEAIVSTGGVRRVIYSEAGTLPAVLDEILAMVDEDAPTVTDVSSTYLRDCDCVSPSGEEAAAGVEALPGTYRRTIAKDALLVDDGLLVMTPDQVMVLEGVGPVVWLAADDSTEDDLRDAALRQLPEPPEGVDPAVVIAGAIRDLVDARLLAQH